jgi:hypothetical protein
VLFVGVIAIATAALLKDGFVCGIDFIPARGLLLGAAAGVTVVLLRRIIAPGPIAPSEISVLTLAVVASRLWLTHGEVSGFASLVIGLTVAIVCLQPAAGIAALAPQVIAAGAISLTAAVGFTRASVVTDSYWADIPLIVAAAGVLLYSFVPRTYGIAFRILLALVPSAIAFLLFWGVADTLAPAFALLLGIAVAAAAWGFDRARSASGEAPGLGAYVAVALTVAGATASFLLAAGYGIGLFALGGVIMVPVLQRPASARAIAALPIACLSFCVAFLAYRLAVLGTGEWVRSNGPGDIWDLIAIGLGVIGAVIVGSFLPAGPPAASQIWGRIEYLFAAIVPVEALAYLWQPRAFAGMFVGAALAPLLFVVSGTDEERSDSRGALPMTAVLIGAILLDIMPLLGDVAKPTREIRIALVVLLIVLAVFRALIPLRARDLGAQAEAGAA